MISRRIMTGLLLSDGGQRMISRRIMTGLLLFAILGCGHVSGDVNARLARLAQLQTARQLELARIERQIEEKKREQQQAECRASLASLRAEVALRKAQCVGARAQYGKCLAEAEAHTTNGGFWGCLGGLGLAVVSGGAAAPLALAGCGTGLALGEATEKDCGPNPVCTPDDDVLGAEVLAAHDLKEWPTCE